MPNYTETAVNYSLQANTPLAANCIGEKFQIIPFTRPGRNVQLSVDGGAFVDIQSTVPLIFKCEKQFTMKCDVPANCSVIMYQEINAVSKQKRKGGTFPALKSAISAYIAGLRTRPPIMFCIADSNGTGEGAGDGGSANLNNAFGNGPFEQIVAYAPTLNGLPVRTTSWFGEGNCNNNGIAVSTYNPRIALGTDWTRTTGSTQFALGGSHMVGAGPSAGYFSYNFGSPITDIELYMVVNNTNSASVGVYNSANTLMATINTNNATASASRFSVTGSFPDGIVKVKNNGAANCYIAGMIAWNSAEKAIILCRGSFSGAAVANYSATTNVWDGMGYFPAIAPDQTTVALTINDIFAGTTRANYNTGLSYIGDFVVRYGDLLVSTGGNGTAAGWTDGTSRGIEAEARIVAAKFGAPFVSIQKEFGSWDASNALGFEYNGNHRTKIGYKDQARVYAYAFLDALGA